MRLKQLLWSIAIVIAISLFVGACKKTSSNDQLNTISIKGTIVDETNTPLAGIVVSMTNVSSTSTTNSNGEFTLTGLDKSKTTFSIEANGASYYTGYKNVSNIDGSTMSTKMMLIKKKILGTLNAATGGTIGSTGLKVTAPANGFTNNDGSTYAGTVTVSANYITKTNPLLADAMPGGDFLAKDASGNLVGMRSYGFIATQFTDASGNTLGAANGTTASITMPSGVANPIAQGAMAWDYNSLTGMWQNPETINASNNEYSISITRSANNIQVGSTFHNIDKPIPMGTITGRVLCPDGKVAPYADITCNGYYANYKVRSNQNGIFKIKVEAIVGTSGYAISADGGASIMLNTLNENSTVTLSNLTTLQCNYTGGTGGIGKGNFIYNTINYGGSCAGVPSTVTACNGIDVGITDVTAYNTFLIYNIPSASSGTFNFEDGFASNGSCKLWGALSIGGGNNIYATQTGTITKTGAKSFTFNCVLYDLITSNTYSVSGSGNY